MTENKRFTWNNEDLVINDNATGKQIEVIEITEIDVLLDLLNVQDNEIQELKARNKRQYERLKKIGDLMFDRDWETLGLIVDEWENEEKRMGHLW